MAMFSQVSIKMTPSSRELSISRMVIIMRVLSRTICLRAEAALDLLRRINMKVNSGREGFTAMVFTQLPKNDVY